jgi:hypothetical protein
MFLFSPITMWLFAHYIQRDCSNQQEVYVTLGGLWWVISIFFKKNLFVLHVLPIPIVHWTII